MKALNTQAPGGSLRSAEEAARISFMAPVSEQLTLLESELERLLPNGSGLIDDVCAHLLSAKGKRMRPALLLLAADMAGGAPTEQGVAAASVVELIHMATLIHDDTIDESTLGRGLPTVNSRWSESVSILMGDFVYSKVFKILAELKMFGAMGVIASSTNEMTVGEMLQIQNRDRLYMTEGEYMSIIDGKTASLMAASCEIGAMVAGRHDGEAEVFSRIGREMGLAFQITDDILDFATGEVGLGKPHGADVRSGRITLPIIAAMRRAPAQGRAVLEELVAALRKIEDASPSPAGASGARSGSGEAGAWESRFRELVHELERHGGFEYARRSAARRAGRAKRLLFSFRRSPGRESLLAAADYIASRAS